MTGHKDSSGSGPSMQAALKRAMNANLVGHNLRVAGHRTSIRLEPTMWAAFMEIAEREGRSIHVLATDIARLKPAETSLTAAIRVFISAYFQQAALMAGKDAADVGTLEDLGVPWSDAGILERAFQVLASRFAA